MDTPSDQPNPRLLVASDFSRSADEAVRQAHAWALRLGADLHALHVASQLLPLHPLFPEHQQRDVSDLVTLERRLGENLSDRIQRLTERAPDSFNVDVDYFIAAPKDTPR